MSPYTSCGLPGDNAGHIITPLFGLAPGGVYHAVPVARHAVRSYRTISPLPGRSCRPGGIFSVALSVGSRRPGITWRPAHVEPGLSSTVTALVEPGSHGSDCPADSRLHISPESDCMPPSLSPHPLTVIPANAGIQSNKEPPSGRHIIPLDVRTEKFPSGLSNSMDVLYFCLKLSTLLSTSACANSIARTRARLDRSNALYRK